MGAEDHGVVGADLQESSVAARELRERGERFALAAGADDAHFARSVAIDVLDIDEVRGVDVQEVQFSRELHVRFHGTAHQDDLAVLLQRDVDDLLNAVDMAREARDAPRAFPWLAGQTWPRLPHPAPGR